MRGLTSTSAVSATSTTATALGANPTSGSLGERVRQAELTTFVGRGDELQRLADLLAHPERLPRAVCITGPPGIGKTALLHECARQARCAGAAAAVIDCHDFDGSVAGFLAALRESAVHGGPQEGSAPALLAVDSLEVLTLAQRRRLREGVFEQLRGRFLLLLAERHVPEEMLSQRAGWRACLETWQLGPLAGEEARRLLVQQGVADDGAVAQILRLAGGHPLVLAVAGDVASRSRERPVPEWRIGEAAVRALHRRLRREADHPGLREMVDASALLPVVDEDLLSAMVGGDVADLVGVYSSLSIVEAVPDGYAIAEPWRGLLQADLRRRRPRRYAELSALARIDEEAIIVDHPATPRPGDHLWLRVLGDGDAGDEATTTLRALPRCGVDRATCAWAKVALGALHDPETLVAVRREHPLGERCADTGTMLGQRLREIVHALTLSRSPRVSEAGRVLHHYYVARIGSHEVVAERLCVSRATLFRRLDLGLTLVCERLADDAAETTVCA